MSKLWYFGGVSVLALAFLIAGAFNISFHNNSANAETTPVVASQTPKSTCGCGAKSQCGGTCTQGNCQCGSSCPMNQQAQ